MLQEIVNRKTPLQTTISPVHA